MKIKKFSKKEAIRFGWNTAKSNMEFFVPLLMIAAFLFIVPHIVANTIMERNIPLGIIFQIADFALTIIISMGIVKISLKFANNEKGKFIDLFSQYRLFFKYLVGVILYSLILFGGIILLIIPGIIWGIKFFFFDYFIIDKGIGPVDSLKKSSAITKGAKWDLFIFSLLLLGINILGGLALLVGLFVTVPLTMVAWAFVYRKLLNEEVETGNTVAATA